MKPRVRRRYYPQRRRRSALGTIQKRATKSSSRRPAALKHTYFSLLADVEHALKVEHKEGASLHKLKRELEQKYGGRKFNVASTKMLQSAVKRLRNRGRIVKIHPNSTVFRFKQVVVPKNYNFFGPGSTKSISRSMTISRSEYRSGSGSLSTTRGSKLQSGSGSRLTTRGSMSRSTLGSMSTRSRSPSNSIVKPVSSAKRARAPVRRRR